MMTMTKEHMLGGWLGKSMLLLLGFAVCAAVVRAEEPAPVEATLKARSLMAGDRLRISIAEAPDMSHVYAVAGDGTIDLDLVGRIAIADMTSDQASEKIKEELEKKFFKTATVEVEVAEFVEGAILVFGAVKTPGSIPFKGDQILTLMEALAMCGGLDNDADAKQVHILRWKMGGGLERQIINVDVRSMLDSLDFQGDQFLRPRDMVVIPSLGTGKAGGEFLALGEVVDAGFHSVTPNLDVIRAITTVGGLTKSAKMEAARLLRPEKNGNYKVVPLDLMRLFGSADVSVNVPVQAGDILFIPSVEQTSGGQVYLLGEVEKKGAIPLPMGQETTLARLLLSVGGIGQFGKASEVKVLRTAPDGSKQTMIVDVAHILKTGDFEKDVPLRDQDVIIVPEKIFSL